MFGINLTVADERQKYEISDSKEILIEKFLRDSKIYKKSLIKEAILRLMVCL